MGTLSKSFLLLFLLAAGTSCDRLDLCDDQPLELPKQDWSRGVLRTDGYYYRQVGTTPQGTIQYGTLVLYRNGVTLISGGGEQEADLDEYLRFIERESRSGRFKDSKSNWGLVTTDGLKPHINYWRSAPCGKFTELYNGDILNDTTFVLTFRKTTHPGNAPTADNVRQLYRFRKFNPKPDSTNNFIP